MTKILLDTDVILDFLFDREPFAENAARIISLCESGKIEGYITPVIISNTYYLLRKTATHEEVIEKLRILLSIIDVLIIDKHIILQALNSSFRDFEDALQNYSAESDKSIDVIITRNVKDYKVSALIVMPPEKYINTINENIQQ
ncbi:PIN domain-containing protein [Bacteroidia bacterium]|nr:PIN domain-containing protein [Bacteroidia bacterium]